MRFGFGSIVVVDHNCIGVVVKSWKRFIAFAEVPRHEVYVREYNSIVEYPEDKMEHFIYNKTLTKEEEGFY